MVSGPWAVLQAGLIEKERVKGVKEVPERRGEALLRHFGAGGGFGWPCTSCKPPRSSLASRGACRRAGSRGIRIRKPGSGGDTGVYPCGLSQG